MKEDSFRRSFWIFDGLIGVAYGIWIGNTLQLVADSGEYLYEKVLTASLIGAFSYLTALFVGFLLSRKFRKIPSWLWMSVLGAMFFAFNKYVVWYLIENWNSRKSDSISEYLLWLMSERIASFSFITIFAALPLIIIFLAIRLSFYGFEKLRNRFS